jgi:superfamily II DNA or RNA helicase
MDLLKKDSFYRKYDLFECRDQKSELDPAIHQNEALKNLRKWFKIKHKASGGILALPTGAGKTFVAVRFLCEGPLSKGYKVLWLAHTHHLLEQAFFTFGPKYEDSKSGYEVGLINENSNREELKVRVVSGAKNNFPPKQIEYDDDIIIGTLQTVREAYNNKLRQFMDFLNSTNDKLFIVFDEAHHAVAPSYRRLIFDLREKYPDMQLLGLTATPTASNENKEIILRKVFPQSVIADATIEELMSQEILAWPQFETKKTNIDAEFDFGDYQRWSNTYADLPQKIIKKLAKNERRNKIIAQCYVNEREKFGKTIIFTDRWYQCVTLCRYLRNRDVKADVMFTMVDRNLGTAGTAQRNLDVLEKFKKGQLDVLINIRMLTEGTDVPDADTVFLTRQTTSEILLTQMIGRALRGPKFGGTEIAHIVSFVDNWDYDINWAKWKELPMGPPEPPKPETEYPHVPLESILIKLIDDAAKRSDSDENYEIESFISLMPVGWYLTEFDTKIGEEDDFKSIKDFVLVFEHKKENEKDLYDNYIEKLENTNLELFEDEDLELNLNSNEPKYLKINNKINQWYGEFFPSGEKDMNKLRYLFIIARHMAQNDKVKPHYFEFEERKNHNIDLFAQNLIHKKLDTISLDQACKQEYNKKDRYWRALYPDYFKFKSEVDYWITRILNPPEKGGSSGIPFDDGGVTPDRPELTPEEIRKKILKRDDYKCLCCGETDRKLLQIDHINPRYRITDNSEDNLQTLCKECNKDKRIENIDFRINKTKLKAIPNEFPKIKEIFNFDKDQVHDLDIWEKFLKRKINLFYECNAVKSINIGNRGKHLLYWKIVLNQGNDSKLIKDYILYLTKEIKFMREYWGFKGPNQIKLFYGPKADDKLIN